MRSFIVAAGLLAASAFAKPLVKRDEPCVDGPPCMTMAQAQTVANNFAGLISNYSDALAESSLTVDFTDYTDSVIELINSGCTGPLTLGQPTFTSRAAFMKGQGSQPDIPFEQLNIWHTCDTVIIRWRTTVAPGAPQFVTGIIVMETEYDGSDFLIKTLYSEFNSGAWLVDLGVFNPTCPAPAPSKAKRSLGGLPLRA